MPIKIKRSIISIFILVNLFTIVYYNAPQRIRKITNKIFPPLKLIMQYAPCIGITGNWRMFTSIEKYNWWIVIKGVYKTPSLKKGIRFDFARLYPRSLLPGFTLRSNKGSKEIILPLPLQSKRTFMETYFYDFREVKFILFLLREKFRQKRYAVYLCRKFQDYEGRKIEKIIYELYKQEKYRPQEAYKNGYYIKPVITRTIVSTYNCMDICK